MPRDQGSERMEDRWELPGRGSLGGGPHLDIIFEPFRLGTRVCKEAYADTAPGQGRRQPSHVARVPAGRQRVAVQEIDGHAALSALRRG